MGFRFPDQRSIAREPRLPAPTPHRRNRLESPALARGRDLNGTSDHDPFRSFKGAETEEWSDQNRAESLPDGP